jgi:hypothetical protein
MGRLGALAVLCVVELVLEDGRTHRHPDIHGRQPRDARDRRFRSTSRRSARPASSRAYGSDACRSIGGGCSASSRGGSGATPPQRCRRSLPPPAHGAALCRLVPGPPRRPPTPPRPRRNAHSKTFPHPRCRAPPARAGGEPAHPPATAPPEVVTPRACCRRGASPYSPPVQGRPRPSAGTFEGVDR